MPFGIVMVITRPCRFAVAPDSKSECTKKPLMVAYALPHQPLHHAPQTRSSTSYLLVSQHQPIRPRLFPVTPPQRSIQIPDLHPAIFPILDTAQPQPCAINRHKLQLGTCLRTRGQHARQDTSSAAGRRRHGGRGTAARCGLGQQAGRMGAKGGRPAHPYPCCPAREGARPIESKPWLWPGFWGLKLLEIVSQAGAYSKYHNPHPPDP